MNPSKVPVNDQLQRTDAFWNSMPLEICPINNDNEVAGKTYSKSMKLLPEEFRPGPHDVICGRGRKIWNSVGNINFRHLVEGRIHDYAFSATKADKGLIISSLVSEVREASPNGGFVRKDTSTGRWYEVCAGLGFKSTDASIGTNCLRFHRTVGWRLSCKGKGISSVSLAAMVGGLSSCKLIISCHTRCRFRDALHESYKSSNKTKRKRRIEEQAKTAKINSELQRHALEQLQSGSKSTCP